MSDDLNMRAATALGWEYMGLPSPTFDVAYSQFKLLEEHAIKLNESKYVNVSSLRFHASYDWAMLGVKAIVELDKPEFEGFYYKFDEDLWGFVNSTPAQITEAWVSVLEEEKRKGNEHGQ